MKRTSLVLNADLLEEATRLSGERTYSRAVDRALLEIVRSARAAKILELAGSGLWEGGLAEMRRDGRNPKRKSPRRRDRDFPALARVSGLQQRDLGA